ncbi:MAG TPA: threonine/serine dehydratase [Gemmatimonadales bacterium]|jgi:threonine dehydratase|nr:threonine/serine dehydratase [Gemmatimonadales bacterium]
MNRCRPVATPPNSVSAESIRAAAAALEGVAVRTRLQPVTLPGGGTLFVKCEQDQPIGAFKIRGAWTALTRLAEPTRRRGVVTHSSGNHAQAIAFAAQRLGIPAVIVMPADAPKVKIAGVRRYGGEIVFVQDRSQRDPTCRAIAAERGMVMVPPYEHADVIAGQGTVGLEILEQCPDVRTVLVPVGGGGLIGGIATWFRSEAPHVHVIGVEPVGAPKLSAALNAGSPTAVPNPHSLADGLLPAALGDLPFSAIRGTVKDAVQVDDDAIRAAVRFLHAAGLTVEPSGAITTAAVLAGLVDAEPPLVAVASGGNIDPDLLQSLVT